MNGDLFLLTMFIVMDETYQSEFRVCVILVDLAILILIECSVYVLGLLDTPEVLEGSVV